MIINDLNIISVAVPPYKTYPILIVDTDAVLRYRVTEDTERAQNIRVLFLCACSVSVVQ